MIFYTTILFREFDPTFEDPGQSENESIGNDPAAESSPPKQPVIRLSFFHRSLFSLGSFFFQSPQLVITLNKVSKPGPFLKALRKALPANQGERNNNLLKFFMNNN